MGNIPAYQGQNSVTYGAAIEVLGDGMDKWVSIYNDTGAALTNGYPYLLTYKVESGVLWPIVIAVAQNDKAINTVIVIDNSPHGKATIADGEWGFAKVRGSVAAFVNGATDIAEGDQLKVVAAADNFIKGASAEDAVIDYLTSAIALEAYTVDADVLKEIFLLGLQTHVA